MNVDGAVAIVTGAAGGIGRAAAQRLAEAGAHVVISDVDAGRVRDTAAEIGHGVLSVAGDASAEVAIEAMIALAVEQFGPVDLFCANAGVIGPSGLGSDEDWLRVVDINLLAHVRAARLLLPGWLDRGSGYFVTTASAAGLLAQVGQATYSVTKHAAVAFAEWLSITYGERGVKVSCLCPMGVNTEMHRAGLASEDAIERLGAEVVAQAGAVLEPEAIADHLLEAIATETFLVLPHPEVGEFFRRRADDHTRWLRGMQRMQAAVAAG